MLHISVKTFHDITLQQLLVPLLLLLLRQIGDCGEAADRRIDAATVLVIFGGSDGRRSHGNGGGSQRGRRLGPCRQIVDVFVVVQVPLPLLMLLMTLQMVVLLFSSDEHDSRDATQQLFLCRLKRKDDMKSNTNSDSYELNTENFVSHIFVSPILG